MAAKRMFSIDVVDTDKFLDMPVSTQAFLKPLPEADGRQQDIDKCQGCRQRNILTFLTP